MMMKQVFRFLAKAFAAFRRNRSPLSAATSTWTAPDGVTRVSVTSAGAGGDIVKYVRVIPGRAYTVTIQGGGAGAGRPDTNAISEW